MLKFIFMNIRISFQSINFIFIWQFFGFNLLPMNIIRFFIIANYNNAALVVYVCVYKRYRKQ